MPKSRLMLILRATKQLAVLIACLTVPLQASGIGPIRAEVYGSQFWKDRSAVLVEITEVEYSKRGTADLRLRPYATVAGEFDSLNHDEIEAKLVLGIGSVIRKLPVANSKALVVLTHHRPKGANGEEGYWISGEIYPFMPAAEAVCVIPSFDCETVVAIKESIRSEYRKAPEIEARARGTKPSVK